MMKTRLVSSSTAMYVLLTCCQILGAKYNAYEESKMKSSVANVLQIVSSLYPVPQSQYISPTSSYIVPDIPCSTTLNLEDRVKNRSSMSILSASEKIVPTTSIKSFETQTWAVKPEFPTKMVKLVILFIVYNIRFNRKISDTNSNLYKSLSNELKSKIIPSIKSEFEYEIKSLEIKVIFKENERGLSTGLHLTAWIHTRANKILFHTTVGKVMKSLILSKSFENIKIAHETVGIYSKDYCSSEITGQNSSIGKFVWPTVQVDTVSKLTCPHGPIYRKASRRCFLKNNDFAVWEDVKNEDCAYGRATTYRLIDLAKKTVDANNAESVTNEIANLTRDSQDFTEEDLNLVSQILKMIVDTKTIHMKRAKKLMKIVNSLMKMDKTAASNSQLKYKSLSRMLGCIRTIVTSNHFASKQEKTTLDVMDAVGIQSIISGSTHFKGITLGVNFTSGKYISFKPEDFKLVDSYEKRNNSATLVTLPPTFLEDAARAGASTDHINIIVYKDDRFFPQYFRTHAGKLLYAITLSTNGLVISVNVGTRNIVRLTKPLEMKFENTENTRGAKHKCVFWDFKEQENLGGWNKDGCYIVNEKSTNDTTVCECHHLTNFAVLLDPYESVSMGENTNIHAQVLGIITYVGVAISMVTLLFTLLTMALFRNLREGIHTKIAIHLSTALLLTLILFVITVDHGYVGYTCRILAMVLHYFLLVTFAWQMVAALGLYISFGLEIKVQDKPFLRKAALASWGVPFAMVSVAAASFWSVFAKDNICIISKYPAMAFLYGPVTFVLLANLSLGILVFRSLSKRNTFSTNKRNNGMIRLRFVLMCCTLLGLTWIFGFVAIQEARLIFQYLFCICNSLQGFFIFYFQILRKAIVQKRWAAFLRGEGKSLQMNFPGSNSNFSLRDVGNSPCLQRPSANKNRVTFNAIMVKPTPREMGELNKNFSHSE